MVILMVLTLMMSAAAAWQATRALAAVRSREYESEIGRRKAVGEQTPDKILREWLYGGER